MTPELFTPAWFSALGAIILIDLYWPATTRS